MELNEEDITTHEKGDHLVGFTITETGKTNVKESVTTTAEESVAKVGVMTADQTEQKLL